MKFEEIRYFSIQSGNPYFDMAKLLPNSKTLDECLEDVVSLETEDAYLNLNGNRFAISYKYDLSVFFDDLLEMVFLLKSKKAGQLQQFWPSNTFNVDWQLSWSEHNLDVSAIFDSVGSIETGAKINRQVFCISKNDFVAEWGEILRVVDDKVNRGDTQKLDCDQLGRLRTLIQTLEFRGRLYQNG